VFHLELRQFPHVARAFNLTRAELDARVLRPLVERRPVVWDDRRWTPEKLKLAIYEGPALGIEEIGMGRGWGNVTKGGENVTERLIAETREAVRSPAALDALKDAILARACIAPLGFDELLALAGELATDLEPDQRTALAARAVWELLGQGRLRLSAVFTTTTT
jgi:hypothetical protein